MRHPLTIGSSCALCIAGLSFLLPPAYLAEALGIAFLLAGYSLLSWQVGFAQKLDLDARFEAAGLLLGGLLQSRKLQLSFLLRRAGLCTLRAACVFALLALPYAIGFRLYFEPDSAFSFSAAWRGPYPALFPGGPSLAFVEIFAAQWLAVALPEEVFFRGYFQSALQAHFRPSASESQPNETQPNEAQPNETRPSTTQPSETQPHAAGTSSEEPARPAAVAHRIASTSEEPARPAGSAHAHPTAAHSEEPARPAELTQAKLPLITRANLYVSIVFALGHFLTTFDPTRLSVFFPSLLFGWVKERTGSVATSALLHALCNLLVVYMNQGYF